MCQNVEERGQKKGSAKEAQRKQIIDSEKEGYGIKIHSIGEGLGEVITKPELGIMQPR